MGSTAQEITGRPRTFAGLKRISRTTLVAGSANAGCDACTTETDS